VPPLEGETVTDEQDEALDLVHQMERLLHSHVKPLKQLLVRLAAHAELRV